MSKNRIKPDSEAQIQSQILKKCHFIGGEGTRTRLEAPIRCKQVLDEEIRSLQQRTKTGYEVTIKWLPGTVRKRDGKQLAEEVRDNTILIYVANQPEAVELVRHGFMEWMLNEHTKPYRQMINRLIMLFEELQYDKKEKTIDALTRLL
jgi:hypothetical protein